MYNLVFIRNSSCSFLSLTELATEPYLVFFPRSKPNSMLLIQLCKSANDFLLSAKFTIAYYNSSSDRAMSRRKLLSKERKDYSTILKSSVNFDNLRFSSDKRRCPLGWSLPYKTYLT